MKKILSFLPLLFLLTPLSALAIGAQCNSQSQYIFLATTGIFSVASIIGIIVLFRKLKKRSTIHEAGAETSGSFPLLTLVLLAISIIIAGYAIFEITTNGPISRRTNDCILGFDVNTQLNSDVLDLDSLTNKTEVETLFNRISTPAPMGTTPCLHLGTDGKQVVFEKTWCSWVEDSYPRYYYSDGEKCYLSAKTLNNFTWDQRNLLEYFKIIES